jgi:prevent-host-death family protein
MKTLTATEASRGFSHLLDDVAAGERVTITRGGHPVATLIPAASATVADLLDIVRTVGPVDDGFAADVDAGLSHVDMTPPDRWGDA